MFTCISRKRLVAAIVGVFLLLCQSIALVQACSLGAQPDKGQIQQPCHSAGEQQDTNTVTGQGPCETVSPAASGFSLFGIDELPVIILKVADSDSTTIAASLSLDPPLLRATPPPLRIVHCCLRN
jgi:hypothetical protein